MHIPAAPVDLRAAMTLGRITRDREPRRLDSAMTLAPHQTRSRVDRRLRWPRAASRADRELDLRAVMTLGRIGWARLRVGEVRVDCGVDRLRLGSIAMAWTAEARERRFPEVQRGWELLGLAVKRRRIALGWSQRDLQRASGLNPVCDLAPRTRDPVRHQVLDVRAARRCHERARARAPAPASEVAALVGLSSPVGCA